MGNIIKFVIFSIVVFIVFMAVLIFAVPGVRTGVMAKMKGEGAVEVSPQEQKAQAEKEEGSRVVKLLKEKEEDLKMREETIVLQEKRISDLKEEVESLKMIVEDYQANIERFVVRIDESKIKNIKKLAQVFSKMAPEEASEILANLTDETVVSILASMKERSSARLLGNYSSRGDAESTRAAVLSEMMKNVVQN